MGVPCTQLGGGPACCGAREGPRPLRPSLAKWTFGILAVTSLHPDPAALGLSLGPCPPGNSRPFVPAPGGGGGGWSLSLGPGPSPDFLQAQLPGRLWPALEPSQGGLTSWAGARKAPGRPLPATPFLLSSPTCPHTPALLVVWKKEGVLLGSPGPPHAQLRCSQPTYTPMEACEWGSSLLPPRSEQRAFPAPSQPRGGPRGLAPSTPQGPARPAPPTCGWTPPGAAPSARPPASVSACPHRPPRPRTASPPAASVPAKPWTGGDRDRGQNPGAFLPPNPCARPRPGSRDAAAPSPARPALGGP